MVIITGASSGIGEACAKVFAKQGNALMLLARRFDRLEILQRELSETYQVDVHCFALDVSDRGAVEHWAEQQSSLLSQASILVNNAGLARGLGYLQDGDLSDWEAMIDTNIKGLLFVTRLVLPHFIKKNEGHIVNLGSVAGHWVYPKGNVYCATKFAVHALTQSLRMDLSGTKIRVTEISPGMVETEFSLVRFNDEAKAKAVYAGMKPLTADDIAEAALWAALRPAHVTIQEIVLYPTDQAAPTVVHRS